MRNCIQCNRQSFENCSMLVEFVVKSSLICFIVWFTVSAGRGLTVPHTTWKNMLQTFLLHVYDNQRRTVNLGSSHFKFFLSNFQVEFAERVFPYVIHNILERGDDASRKTLSEQFRSFFSYCSGTSVVSSRESSPLLTEVPSINSGEMLEGKWEKNRVMTSILLLVGLEQESIIEPGSIAEVAVLGSL